jgi:hypothetical protein
MTKQMESQKHVRHDSTLASQQAKLQHLSHDKSNSITQQVRESFTNQPQILVDNMDENEKINNTYQVVLELVPWWMVETMNQHRY